MKKKAVQEQGDYPAFAERLESAIGRILNEKSMIYSIQDKADALGFSKSFMADLLKGRKLPSSANILEIAIKTGVRAEWLWTGTPPMVDKITEGAYLYIGDLNPDQQEAVKLHLRSYKK